MPPSGGRRPSDAYTSGAQKKGRGEYAGESLLVELTSPTDAAMMSIALAGSACTPALAHTCVGDSKGGAACAGLHMAIGCTISKTAHIPLDRRMPDCLRHTGNVPAGWLQTPRSQEMDAEPWGEGGCSCWRRRSSRTRQQHRAQGGPRGSHTHTHEHASGAVIGWVQHGGASRSLSGCEGPCDRGQRQRHHHR